MFQNLSNLTKAVLFYIITMAISLPLILLFQAILPRAEILVLINMLTPLLAALIMLFGVTGEGYTKEGRASLGLGNLGLRWWGLAFVLPIPVLLLSYGFVWITGLARLATGPGEGGLSAPLLNFFPNLLAAIVLGFGEEFGFRGYLLPRLMELGAKRALLLSGFLHGVWHLPIILMTPFYPTEGNLFIFIVLFLLTLTAAGVIYGYMRLISDSVWVPTLFHGAFNAFWDLFRSITIVVSPVAVQYLSGEAGLLTFLGTAAAAAYLIYRLEHQSVVLEQKLSTSSL
jgi:membrane protease YdiL (CAAX protease family)